MRKHVLPMEALDSNMSFPSFALASGTVSQIKGPSAGSRGGSHTPRLSEMDRELHDSPAAGTGGVSGWSDFRTLAPCLCSSAYPWSTAHVQRVPLQMLQAPPHPGIKGSKSIGSWKVSFSPIPGNNLLNKFHVSSPGQTGGGVGEHGLSLRLP